MAAEQRVDLVELLSAFAEVAVRTGGVIRSVFEDGRLGVVEKAEGAPEAAAAGDVEDPQTVADRRGQAVIVEALRKRWPAVRLVGEEGHVEPDEEVRHLLGAPSEPHPVIARELGARMSAEERTFPLSELVVWIDPLDGTKGFTRGEKDGVTVLVGVSRGGRALGGVVHRPFTGATAWGVAGVYATGAPFQPLAERDAARRKVVTSTHHSTEKLQRLVQSVKPTEVCNASGGANKALRVLEGHSDAWFYPSPGTKRWDTCAIEAVVSGFGGRLTDAFGDPIVYEQTDDERALNNSRGVLCTLVAHESYVLDKKHVAEVDTVNGPGAAR